MFIKILDLILPPTFFFLFPGWHKHEVLYIVSVFTLWGFLLSNSKKKNTAFWVVLPLAPRTAAQLSDGPDDFYTSSYVSSKVELTVTQRGDVCIHIHKQINSIFMMVSCFVIRRHRSVTENTDACSWASPAEVTCRRFPCVLKCEWTYLSCSPCGCCCGCSGELFKISTLPNNTANITKNMSSGSNPVTPTTAWTHTAVGVSSVFRWLRFYSCSRFRGWRFIY